MVKFVDSRVREEEILELVIESYISESKPISSGYLCQKYQLSYSPATVRNVMLELEKQGLLSHIYTSSGRVPTKQGFKFYVGHFREEDIMKDDNYGLQASDWGGLRFPDIIDKTLDVLTRLSGYTSLLAVSGESEGLFFKGMRFILEQPEFEDIARLRHIFNAFEVRMTELQELLFNCIDEKVQVLIGDDIGFDEISDCSLVVSGLRRPQLRLALALIGPMRMDYLRAASCLYSVRNQLKALVE